jgi:hypothetical protein
MEKRKAMLLDGKSTKKHSGSATTCRTAGRLLQTKPPYFRLLEYRDEEKMP